MTTTCTITCNGAPLEVDGTVATVVTGHLGTDRASGIAVAVNGEVLPRVRWSVTLLADGDVVEIVTAVQGG